MNRADWAVRHLPEMTAGLRPALRAHLVHTLRPDDLAAAVAVDDTARPTGLHLHDVTRDGVPYVGIELAGGLGALMHGPRVVAFGATRVASLRRLAEQDAAGARTGLDKALLGHWSSAPFDHGVMETSEFELRADGTGWSLLANLGGEWVARLTWRCPAPGLLELRTEDGQESRHRYLVTAAPVASVTFEEPVEFCHQYAKSG
ncbi:hypothetical protein DI272_12620 [Streptomyces sp. Act143]|uniref:hypothetical protein n=1 Tax=Streptomyces sp. Act143 TaxID=2200760 RepID=UPI000D6830A9|nr:hypothetical protein [Streptomyces sp. Act143]PWI14910.1 hypothetical protein DI272_12620 [Streptomyces sp. Act143]